MSRKVKKKSQSSELFEQMNCARIQLSGNFEALIDGCCAVLEYNSEKIKIDIGDKEICFSGLNLCVDDFNLAEIRITGEIISIEFSD